MMVKNHENTFFSGHSHHFQNEDPFTTTYHTAPVTQADPNFIFKTGHSFYSDPGLDLSWHPLSQSSPVDIAIAVAVSLFGLSLLLQVKLPTLESQIRVSVL